MNLKNNLEDSLLHISFIMMFMLPLFPTNVKPYVIGLLGLSVLLSNFGEKITFDYNRFFVNSSIYFLMILSLFYSSNIEYGLSKLESMSSLIIFPLIFCLLPKSKINLIVKNKYNYMLVYVISVLVFNLSSMLYHIGHYKMSILTHFLTVNNIAQGPFNIHPIYLSLHIAVALLFSFFILQNFKSNYKRVGLIIIDFILVFFLLLLMKKGPIIAASIVLFLFVLFQKNRKILYVFAVILSLTFTIIISITEYRQKFSELTKIENISEGNFTSTNIRYSIYKFAVAKIVESPVLGYGIGDFNDVLIDGYKEGSDFLYEGRYNSHNQYFSFMLSLGIVGLLAILLMIFRNLIVAIRYDNQVVILLLIFYGLMMMFENILEREDGVIYFSFFIGFFSFLSFKNEYNTSSQNQILR